jgi:pyridoxal biosynthesis lyase PdxS
MERVYLCGSEDVAQAGRNVAGGAEVIRNAVGNLDDALFRHGRALDEWLDRFESVLEQDRAARAASATGRVG